MLAPASLVVFGALFFVVIAASLDEGSDRVERERPRETQSERRRAERPRPDTSDAARRVYVVKSGDTLATIASKTKVPIDQIVALNPQIDPRALVTGQRIKLRE
jgi:hypothetical protein